MGGIKRGVRLRLFIVGRDGILLRSAFGRTADTWIFSPLLYRLSYLRLKKFLSFDLYSVKEISFFALLLINLSLHLRWNLSTYPHSFIFSYFFVILNISLNITTFPLLLVHSSFIFANNEQRIIQ